MAVKQKIKNVIKVVVPPIVMNLFRKLKKNGKSQLKVEVWLGNFSSWDEAKMECTGYDANIILEKCKKALLKVKNGEAVYERDSVLFDTIQYSWGLLAGLQRAALENNGNLCVLDFGGSLGSTYYQNKEFLSGLKKIEWCIVEQAHFVDCGKENFENEQLKFYYSIEECLENKKPNVLLLSGVLQYVPNIYGWLSQFNNSGIEFLIIDRTTSIVADENIVTIQRVPSAIYEASYPCYFFSHNFIENQLTNYKLLVFFDGAAEPVDYYLNNSVTANWKGYIYKKN